MKKIFCLETEWNFSETKRMRDKSSILPLLQFLEESMDIEFIFRKVASREDLKYYLYQLKYKTYKDFQIVYLAFHGNSKSIEMPSEPNNPLTLDELSEISNNQFEDKIIHFGSCRTLNTSQKTIIDFKHQTGAKIVSGYSKSVDFMKSSILDFAYMSELASTQKLSTIENKMERLYNNLMNDLGFKIF
jgi:hypothetical protein